MLSQTKEEIIDKIVTSLILFKHYSQQYKIGNILQADSFSYFDSINQTFHQKHFVNKSYNFIDKLFSPFVGILANINATLKQTSRISEKKQCALT